MGKKKKKKTNTPGVKQMNRGERLASAASSWLETYNGKRRIRGYRKHFGVDAGTAIAELSQLGVLLTGEEIQKARQGERAAANAKQARKKKRLQRQKEQQEVDTWSDGTFAYIAGYTDWGFPYGITWEEMERIADQVSLDRTVSPRSHRNHRRQSTADEAEWPLVQAREAEEVPFDLEECMKYYADVEVPFEIGQTARIAPPIEGAFCEMADTTPDGLGFDPNFAQNGEE
ncbi:hypothetical protein [Paenibacillus oceani]|uniref:Uncharacterized protein n=1 Tax=Paenibacillus oceani TaxID=2772510 RepID=A0A927CD46_9BACL|nr:hypothetical protein [Paenibacillus oceani]MBD2864627.1 hypothetical protein [Paenibacillus oceani]